MRIWLDTDLGSDVDDALALAYLLRHAETEVVGISTVFGDVDLRTRCVEALLEIAEVSPIPVLTGLGKPLFRSRAGVMFGHEGRGLLDDPVPIMRIDEEEGAQPRIAALAAAIENSAPDWVVAIGPMTNMGALAAAGISLPPLAVMGGKSQGAMLPGMRKEIGEWNFFSDPDAARSTLSAKAGENMRVVPAEITYQTALEKEDLEALANGDPLCKMLHTLCNHWLDFLRAAFRSEDPKVCLHDPLTAATLVVPALCAFEKRCVEIDDRGHLLPSQGAPNVELAVDVDVPALRNHLVVTWTRGASGD